METSKNQNSRKPYKKRLKKNEFKEKQEQTGRFKITPEKVKTDFTRHRKLTDLIKENESKYGKSFNSMNDCDYDSDDYQVQGFTKAKNHTSIIMKSKTTKSQKAKTKKKKTVQDFFDDRIDSEEDNYVKSKTTVESNIWIKRSNTSYKKKKGAYKRAQTTKRKPQNKNKKRGGGGRRKKRTAKDFYDNEAESEGGSINSYEGSGSDRYESDFLCDDEDEQEQYL